MSIKSFKIGNIEITDPVFLAPMSGVTDLPFRKIVKSFGVGLMFSEMIASRSMIEHSKKTLKMASNYEDEFPMAVQLAGCDPEIMAEAAKINVDKGAAIIDINFGCPVKKIVNKFAGSALMKDIPLATKIMERTVKAVNVPVTVKMRLGWDENNINAPELAKIAENIGIKMVTVHGRTRNQLYKGKADWNKIRNVREVINIPLIANGDILTPQDAKKAISITGADGVMIGRGCYGKPWIIKQTIDYLKTGKITNNISKKELHELVINHYDSILSYYGKNKGVEIARKHLSWYCKSLKGAATLRAEINKLSDPELVKETITNFFENQETTFTKKK